MKDTKDHLTPVTGSVGRSWRSFLSSKNNLWQSLYYNMSLIIFAGVVTMILLVCRENAVGSNILTGYSRSLMFSRRISRMQRQWNYSSFNFEPNVADWNQLRARWLEQNQQLMSEEGSSEPRVMVVTGSSPNSCDPIELSHLLLRSAKNKLDYCRMHEMQFFYNLGEMNPDFSDSWVKLPVIRMLILQHPELEWIWWLDADAIFTDMSFEPPFADLKDYNLVLYGDDQLVYNTGDWKSVSTANFMIRNCQWSLDLLDAWGSMGTDRMREQSGKFESDLLPNRPWNLSGDDQSSIIVLLAQDQRNPVAEQKWVPSVKLVKGTEFVMNGDWTRVGPHLEELSLDESNRVPFVTHFTGCLPACTGRPSDRLPSKRANKLLDVCRKQLERAFDFADNQVYRQYGFQPRILGSYAQPLIKSEAIPTDGKMETVEGGANFSMPPRVTDWDEKRQVWMRENPSAKKDEVLLVSGSAPKPCISKQGDHTLLRGFKNRIDYARINGISKVFYNMAAIDKDMTGWWSKLPLLKMLMLSNPNVEWIWWMDSDAAFTDMTFRPPFSSYNESGHNLALFGTEYGLYTQKSFTSINTGNILVRNCQWSLDLLDRWASYGATQEVRKKNEAILVNNLSNREFGMEADDQGVLAYVLIDEQDKWRSQVRLEDTYCMSGWWMDWVPQFGDDIEWTSPDTKPFVTHFCGCQPCSQTPLNECVVGMDKAYNFADNQVLLRYGLRHVHVNSSELLRTSSGLQDINQSLAEPDLHLVAKEEIETAMTDPAHTTRDKQAPSGKVGERQDALDTVTEEDDVATGSTNNTTHSR